MPEYALTRNYLDLMVELPWSKSTKGKKKKKKWVQDHMHTYVRYLKYSNEITNTLQLCLCTTAK